MLLFRAGHHRLGASTLILVLCASILTGCSHAQAQQGVDTAEGVATGGGIILLLGAAVVIGTGALIIGAIENAQEDEATTSAVPTGSVASGNYTATNDHWSIRVAVSGSRFRGNAFCKLTGTPMVFSGQIAGDGSIRGIGDFRKYPFGQYEGGLSFAVTGKWPAIELKTKRTCGSSIVQLQQT